MKKDQLNIQKKLPFAACAIVLLLSSCAQMLSPGGGAIDRTPPAVVHYSPDSAQLQFNQKNIAIEFNEFIQLKDLNSQLVISPPLEKTPEVTVKNKTLYIALDKNEVLKPNTTYNIHFGNAVQDVNEGNAKEGFHYLFSTGNFIDSLSVDGKVEDAFTHQTEKSVLVFLYADPKDSAIYKHQPDYFTKTLADGSFHLSNVKAGSYTIYALKDLNGNFRYDAPAENIAFQDKQVTAGGKDKILLELFQESPKKIHLKKHVHEQYGKVSLNFDHGSDSISVSLLNCNDKGVQEYMDFSSDKDSLDLWLRNYQKDSLYLQVKNGNQVLDTLELKWIKKEDAVKSKKHPWKLSVVESPDGRQDLDLNKAVQLGFNQRMADTAVHNIQLRIGGNTVEQLEGKVNKTGLLLMHIDSVAVKGSNRKEALPAVPKTNWKENTTYELLILPGSIRDIYDHTNDTIQLHFKTREDRYYGALKLNLDLPANDGSYLIYLMDEKENLLQTLVEPAGTHSLQYNYLLPQKYKIKVILDENGDGKWNTGNLPTGKQPEQVLYHQETIMIRSNWDLELDWKISNDQFSK